MIRPVSRGITTYRLLGAVSPSPETLPDALRTIVFAAGHVAAGNAAAVVESFQSIPVESLSNAYELAILQGIAFVGFPRVLTAAAALKQADIHFQSYDSGNNPQESRSQEQFIRDGEEVFKQVYGRAEAKIRDRIKSFHPVLLDWALRFGYGEILSRPGPTLKERELCAIGMLSGGGQSTEPLLVSHLRGALNAGATRADIRAVLDHTVHVHGEEAAEQADAVYTIFDRTRAIL